VKRKPAFAKCEFDIPLKELMSADIASVDTCTGLLPDKKPRYVMGVVQIPSASS
jgi:hypothetical protein